MFPVAFIGGASPFHMFLLLLVVLLLFGNRLPSMMRSLGRGVVEFKKGMEGIKDETDEEQEAKEKEKTAKDKQAAQK